MSLRKKMDSLQLGFSATLHSFEIGKYFRSLSASFDKDFRVREAPIKLQPSSDVNGCAYMRRSQTPLFWKNFSVEGTVWSCRDTSPHSSSFQLEPSLRSGFLISKT